MKPLNFITTCLIGTFVFITACGPSTGDIAKIIEERDSLRTQTKLQQRRMENVTELMSIINSGLDSIATNEGLIFPKIGEMPNTKEDMLQRVEKLADIISLQRQKIDNLEKKLAEETEEAPEIDKNMDQIISRFRQQLEEKDKQIASLKEELNQKNVNITQLQAKIGVQSQTIAELDRRNTMQTEALKRQDAMLNQCYMIVGDKKTLQDAGIIKKGKLVANAALDRSKFVKVDIRSFTEMEFDAKKPRILTSMPEGSYTLITNGKNHYILKIQNPSEFWRISNYLVVQTN